MGRVCLEDCLEWILVRISRSGLFASSMLQSSSCFDWIACQHHQPTGAHAVKPHDDERGNAERTEGKMLVLVLAGSRASVVRLRGISGGSHLAGAQ